MANENPLWGAPRIHSEMLKLGFDISESTVLQYMPKNAPRTANQRWKTFLKNHSAQIVSVDFLVVPTITFKPLFLRPGLPLTRQKKTHSLQRDCASYSPVIGAAIAKCLL